MDKEYQSRHKTWKARSPPELFQRWAKDISAKLCHNVYDAMAVNHADGTREIVQPFKLEEEMYKEWMQIAEDLTNLAGQRLAFMLNDIIDHRRHHNAHKEGRSTLHHRKWKYWQRNLMLNFGIAC